MENVETATKGSNIQPKEIPLTKMEKDGNGHEVEVYNLDHPDNCPKSGTVKVELIKKKNYMGDRDAHVTISAYKDKETGIIWGKKIGIDNYTKQIMWLSVKLNPLNIFDRGINIEAERAALVLNSPVVEGSRNAGFKEPWFRQHDEEKAAYLKIKRIKDGQRALEVARSLYGEKLINMARNLNLPIISMSPIMIEAAILDKAEQDPKGFLAIYDSPHFGSLTILNMALEVSIIVNEPQTGYTYKGRFMGNTEWEAIDFLIKNKDIAAAIEMQAKAKQADSIKSMSATKTNIISEKDKDTELAIANKQLAEQKALIEKLTAQAVKGALDEKNPNEEWANDIRERAKKLKIKASHAYKSEESLKKLEKLVIDKEKLIK